MHFKVGGIKCDTPHCNYKDMSVKYEDYPDYIGKPCPICGSNLLTQADYDSIKFMEKLMSNPILNAINDICLKLGMEESHYTVNMNGTGKMDLVKIADHIDTRV